MEEHSLRLLLDEVGFIEGTPYYFAMDMSWAMGFSWDQVSKEMMALGYYLSYETFLYEMESLDRQLTLDFELK